MLCPFSITLFIYFGIIRSHTNTRTKTSERASERTRISHCCQSLKRASIRTGHTASSDDVYRIHTTHVMYTIHTFDENVHHFHVKWFAVMLNEEEAAAETLNKQWNEIKSSENDRGERCCVAIWISSTHIIWNGPLGDGFPSQLYTHF